MAKAPRPVVEQKLDEIIRLLKHLLAVELARTGMPKDAIGRNLKVAQADVVALLKGAKELS